MSHSILEIWRDEHRDLRAAPRRGRRVSHDLEQKVNRREIGILRSGRGESFALPRLASDGCSVARAFRATGALSKTPVLCGHLDNLIFSELFTEHKARRDVGDFLRPPGSRESRKAADLCTSTGAIALIFGPHPGHSLPS